MGSDERTRLAEIWGFGLLPSPPCEFHAVYKLAQRLVFYGANVNINSRVPPLRACCLFAINRPQNAARFIEFLLYQGADPYQGRRQNSIMALIPARRAITKTYGISFEELVERVHMDRDGGQPWPGDREIAHGEKMTLERI